MARQGIVPAPYQLSERHWLFAVHFDEDEHGNIGGSLLRHASCVEDFVLAGGDLEALNRSAQQPGKTLAELAGWSLPPKRLCE